MYVIYVWQAFLSDNRCTCEVQFEKIAVQRRGSPILNNPYTCCTLFSKVPHSQNDFFVLKYVLHITANPQRKILC